MIGLVFVAIAGLAAGWILRDLIRRDKKARGELLEFTGLSRSRRHDDRRPW